MEYNIYFFKSKENIGTDDWRVQSRKDDEQERSDFAKEYDRQIKKLQAVDKENYAEAYKKTLDKLATFFNFPDLNLACIGLTKDYKAGEFIYDVKPVEKMMVERERIITGLYQKFEADFDTVDFVYLLMKPHLVDNACWVGKELINEIIDKCTKAIEDKHHPEDYVPTTNDVYDKKYFKQLRETRKTFKHLLKLMNKKYLLYAIYVPKQES